MSELTHFNEQGRAKMVDVTEKAVTHRIAVAAGEIHMAPETLEKIKAGTMKKGDVLAVAQVAGIQAAVQPVQTGLPQGSSQLREQGAVGGKTQLLKARDGPQLAAQLHDPPADQRLSASEANFLDTQPNCRPGDVRQLLQGEDVPVVPLGHALRRHTVAAAVIAEIRDAQPQVIDCTSAPIQHGALRS